MPIIKRINKYQGLRDIDVFIDEKGATSEYFNITGMPTEIPQGKSSFLVGGSPFLKNNIELKIEMIDSAGNTVYMEPVPNYLESQARRVSIEVYPDTAPGTAKLYILGELKRNYKDFQQPPIATQEITDPPFSAAEPPSQAFLNQFVPDVPSNFQGVYNVRYEMPVQINTTIPNTEPILFYKQPRLTVREIVKGFVIETAPSSSYDVSGSISINRIPESQEQTAPATPPDGQPTGLTESDRNDVGKQLSIFKNRRAFKIDPYRNSLFGRRGRLMRRSSPEVDQSTGILKDVTATPENAEDTLTSTFVGETLHINNITIDTSKLPPGLPYSVTGSYSTQIKKVINNNTFVPLEDFTVDLPNGGKFPADITNASFTASIHPTPGFLISGTDFRSFADITIGNLRTFSGDVYKAMVYGKSKGSLGDFEPMYEAFIESAEVLVDKLSPTGFTSTGYFYTQSIVDAYWDIEGGSHVDSLSEPDAVGTAVESDDIMIDGVMISGSNHNKGTKVNFRTKHQYDLEPNVAYNVQFNAHFYTAPKEFDDGHIENDALLEVYVTGSKAGNKELLGRVDIPSFVPQGRINSIFKTFISSTIPEPKMALEFHVKAGRFVIQDLSVRPASETNFNPDYHRVIVPMPHPLPVKPDTYDFVVELYDINNNLAETFAVTEDIEFTGAPLMISGPGNFLSGSMMLGTGMELYGGSAFLRTRGYRGLEHSRANNLGGFMVFSGSIGGPSAAENLITSSEDYDGVGFEVVDFHDSNNPRFLKFGTSPSRFEVVTDEFFFGKPRTQANSQFVSGSGGRIEISSSFFHLTPEGKVTGSAILLGKKPDNFLQFADDQLTVKGNLSVDQISTPAEIGGSPSTVANASSSITSDGFAKFASASIAGFEVSTDEIKSSNNILRLKSSGEMTGSSILLGSKPNNFLQFADSTLTVRGDLSVDQLFLPAEIGGASSNVTNASSSLTSEGFAKFVSASIGGWNVSSTSISSPGENIKLDSTNKRFIVTDALGNERIHLGEVDGASVFGLKVFTDNGTTDSDLLVELGQGDNSIAGWNINSDTLEGGDLILNKVGSIRSRGYQSDVAGSGFILTAASGGFLEVENAKIRGTLSTAVFEKESVNAVGGQLYVANSTVLTGSADNPGGFHSSTQKTMSVVNVGGFTGSYNNDGEILTIKKVTDTGFNTEYVLVQSSSRFNPSSDTDFSGNIFVQRGYGVGTSGDSGSLGDVPGAATTYSGSQVIVSTGRIGTGYIRLNANPNDQATPYIDIVERTGAGLYDISLKARLGDLSGVAGSRNVPENFTGFGLMSEVAFLSGSNIKLEAPKFLLGDKNASFVSGSNSKMEISSSNFHLTAEGSLDVGDGNLVVDTSGNVTMIGAITANSGRIGGAGGWVIEEGLIRDANSKFHLSSGTQQGQTNLWYFDGDDGYRGIAFGDLPTGNNFSHSNSTGSYWIQRNDTNVFRVGNNTSFIKFDSGQTSDIQIATPNFSVDSSGNTTMSGTVTATAGAIGGFTLANNQLTGSIGAKIATQASGQRAVVDGTNNSLNFFDSNNNEVVRIGSGITNPAGHSGYGHGLQITKGTVVIDDVVDVGQPAPALEITARRTTQQESDTFYGMWNRFYGGPLAGATGLFNEVRYNGSSFPNDAKSIDARILGNNLNNSAEAIAVQGRVSGVGTSGTSICFNAYSVQYQSVQPTYSYGIKINIAEADNTYGAHIKADGSNSYGIYVKSGHSYFEKGVSIGNDDVQSTAGLTIGANAGTMNSDGSIEVVSEGLNLDITESGKYAVGIRNASSGGHGLLIEAGAAGDSSHYPLKIQDRNSDGDLFVVSADGKATVQSDINANGNIVGDSSTNLTNMNDGTFAGTVQAEQITSTDDMSVNDNLSVGGKILMGGETHIVGFKARSTLTGGAGQSVSNTTWTKVNYGTTVYDHSSNFDTSTDTFTCPVAGIYQFNANILWASQAWGTGNNTVLTITLNDGDATDGTGAYASEYKCIWSGRTDIFGSNVSTTMDCAANDLIRVRVYQNSGSTKELYGYSVQHYITFSGALIASDE